MTSDLASQSAPAESDRRGSSFRSGSVARVDSRLTGGSGVQRSHLRGRKQWLKHRARSGRSWAVRKASSSTYCPAKTR